MEWSSQPSIGEMFYQHSMYFLSDILFDTPQFFGVSSFFGHGLTTCLTHLKSYRKLVKIFCFLALNLLIMTCNILERGRKVFFFPVVCLHLQCANECLWLLDMTRIWQRILKMQAMSSFWQMRKKWGIRLVRCSGICPKRRCDCFASWKDLSSFPWLWLISITTYLFIDMWSIAKL